MSQLDQDTWKRIAQSIDRQARHLIRRQGRLARAEYSDALIAKLYFWSVVHDRPVAWAADPDHLGHRLFRPRQRPSRSQFQRRVNTPRFTTLLTLIHQDLAGPLDPSDGGRLDGKPLPVSSVSKDMDARSGHVTGGFAKGYKLHIWATGDRRIALWSVMPLNVGETLVAAALSDFMPMFNDRAMTLADGNFDSGRMHEALARRNGALLSKPRGMNVAAPEAWLRQQANLPPKKRGGGACRQAALEAWKKTPALGRFVYRERIHVEGTLSNLCSYGGGLGPLPAWVRTLPRVRRWVGAKIILYHARLFARNAASPGV